MFVLTHHPRPPVGMEGGTTFHFVTDTDGIESALRQTREAADGADVRIGGGAQVVRQYLRAGLIDETHLVVVPILLATVNASSATSFLADRYQCVETFASSAVTHVRLSRR